MQPVSKKQTSCLGGKGALLLVVATMQDLHGTDLAYVWHVDSSVAHGQAGGPQSCKALVALGSSEDVGKLLLAEPLKADELPGLIRLLNGVRCELLPSQRTRHDKAGSHLSATKVPTTTFVLLACVLAF